MTATPSSRPCCSDGCTPPMSSPASISTSARGGRRAGLPDGRRRRMAASARRHDGMMCLAMKTPPSSPPATWRAELATGDVVGAAGMLGIATRCGIGGHPRQGARPHAGLSHRQYAPCAGSGLRTASTPCASEWPMACSTMALPASAAAPPSTATARRCSKPSSSIIPGDLYGQICAVSFFGHLRDEMKFDGPRCPGRPDEAG